MRNRANYKRLSNFFAEASQTILDIGEDIDNTYNYIFELKSEFENYKKKECNKKRKIIDILMKEDEDEERFD